MDGNKDEAAKCLRIGKEALQSGDRARALKFLSKARRLDPSIPVDALLSAASAAAGASSTPPPPPPPDTSPPTSSSSSSSSSSSGTAAAATARARAGARASASASSSTSSSRSYTEEQAAIVRQIKIQKDYYQILGVEKGCTVEDVRRAYLKLSLKVHPDKNQAPGAEEAFKAVSKAFQCLSNDDSRKSYDATGDEEEPALRRAPARHGSHGFNGFYEADVDADEIFRNFFYGGAAPPTSTPSGTFHFRTGGMGPRGMHGGGAAGSAASNSKLVLFFQILPVILLLLLDFLPSSEPPLYSLSRTYSYGHKLQTPRGVPYFIKSAKFEEKYPFDSPQRAALEQSIETEHVAMLRQYCRIELQRRQWGRDIGMEYCERLQKFETVAE